MKDKFPGFYKKTDKEIKEIWNNAIITFDTNTLLNLYRYSKDTQEELLDKIQKLSDKVWMTHQASLEYHSNRCEVIAEQEKTYKEFGKKIENIENELRSTNKPPFLSKKLHSQLEIIFSQVKKEVEKSSSDFSTMLSDDDIYNSLNHIFHNKVGDGYLDARLKEIHDEGKERYENKIPPGYEDIKKTGDNKYGDLILWYQIIDLAMYTKKPVILITDERKKDWWWKLKDDRILGARQELVNEIWNKCNVDFLMYSSERFLSFATSYLKEKINEQALEEIRERKRIEVQKIINESMNNTEKRRYFERGNYRQNEKDDGSNNTKFELKRINNRNYRTSLGRFNQLSFRKRELNNEYTNLVELLNEQRIMLKNENSSYGTSRYESRIESIEEKINELKKELRYINDTLDIYKGQIDFSDDSNDLGEDDNFL